METLSDYTLQSRVRDIFGPIPIGDDPVAEMACHEIEKLTVPEQCAVIQEKFFLQNQFDKTDSETLFHFAKIYGVITLDSALVALEKLAAINDARADSLVAKLCFSANSFLVRHKAAELLIEQNTEKEHCFDDTLRALSQKGTVDLALRIRCARALSDQALLGCCLDFDRRGSDERLSWRMFVEAFDERLKRADLTFFLKVSENSDIFPALRVLAAKYAIGLASEFSSQIVSGELPLNYVLGKLQENASSSYKVEETQRTSMLRVFSTLCSSKIQALQYMGALGKQCLGVNILDRMTLAQSFNEIYNCLRDRRQRYELFEKRKMDILEVSLIGAVSEENMLLSGSAWYAAFNSVKPILSTKITEYLLTVLGKHLPFSHECKDTPLVGPLTLQSSAPGPDGSAWAQNDVPGLVALGTETAIKSIRKVFTRTNGAFEHDPALVATIIGELLYRRRLAVKLEPLTEKHSNEIPLSAVQDFFSAAMLHPDMGLRTHTVALLQNHLKLCGPKEIELWKDVVPPSSLEYSAVDQHQVRILQKLLWPHKVAERFCDLLVEGNITPEGREALLRFFYEEKIRDHSSLSHDRVVILEEEYQCAYLAALRHNPLQDCALLREYALQILQDGSGEVELMRREKPADLADAERFKSDEFVEVLYHLADHGKKMVGAMAVLILCERQGDLPPEYLLAALVENQSKVLEQKLIELALPKNDPELFSYIAKRLLSDVSALTVKARAEIGEKLQIPSSWQDADIQETELLTALALFAPTDSLRRKAIEYLGVPKKLNYKLNGAYILEPPPGQEYSYNGEEKPYATMFQSLILLATKGARGFTPAELNDYAGLALEKIVQYFPALLSLENIVFASYSRHIGPRRINQLYEMVSHGRTENSRAGALGLLALVTFRQGEFMYWEEKFKELRHDKTTAVQAMANKVLEHFHKRLSGET